MTGRQTILAWRDEIRKLRDGIEECQTVADSFEDFMKKIISEEIRL